MAVPPLARVLPLLLCAAGTFAPAQNPFEQLLRPPQPESQSEPKPESQSQQSQSQSAQSTATTAKPIPSLPRDLDAFVDKVRETFAVPGLALAVVHGREVLLAKGYGERRLGGGEPVDAATRFPIASNTKAITAVALALLVEDGRLQWDAPVQRFLPAFALSDPWVSRELTVRDLLVHRSGLGLGAGDLLWWPGSTLSRAEIAARLRHVPLATSFRGTYAYDNVLYLVAGELIEAVSGETYERFVAERILRPAGMTRSRLLGGAGIGGAGIGAGDGAAANGDVVGAADANEAALHAFVDGALQEVPPFVSPNVNPAGGVLASAGDLAAWLQVLLAGGAVHGAGPDAGARLYGPKTARELVTFVVPTPIAEPDHLLGDLRPNFAGYALGLGVRDYRGRKAVTHSGGLPGAVSRVFFVPEANVGVAVLTNQESTFAVHALVLHLIDHLLGCPDRDWLLQARIAHDAHEEKAAKKRTKVAAARAAGTKPSLPLGRYAGVYRDAWCGEVRIADEDGALSLHFADSPALHGTLEHWHHDTFVVRWRDRSLRADAFVTFALDAAGEIARATMAPADPDVDFSYDFQDLLLLPVRDAAKGASR